MLTLPKNSRDLDYHFGVFWKISCSTTHMQSFIARASLVQNLQSKALSPLSQVIRCQKIQDWLGLIKRFIRKDSVDVLSAKGLIKLDACDPVIQLDDSKTNFGLYIKAQLF